MSWLARSLANLRLDDNESENDAVPNFHNDPSPSLHEFQEHHERRIQNEAIDSSSSLSSESEDGPQSRGVKEDLTELKQTLSRQIWGVASFLAPPPAHSDHQDGNRSVSNLDQSVSGHEGDPSDSEVGPGIRGDFAEIGGRFRSGVTEISKMASNYFPFGSEESEREIEELELDEDGLREDAVGISHDVDDLEGGELGINHVEDDFEGGELGINHVENDFEGGELGIDHVEDNFWESAVGISDEVLAFARNIAMHPETWLDFPLDEEEDLNDFVMTDAQQEHALAIERLAPRLAALRIELCPCHMSESYFWKVYFVLLHSRLNKHDADILSSPQVMEARAMWMQELQKQTKPESDWYGRSVSYVSDRNILQEDLVPSSSSDATENMTPRMYAYVPTTFTMTKDYETEKHPVEPTEIQFIDKSVIEEKPVVKADNKDLVIGPSKKLQFLNYEDDEDDWPEEDSELDGYVRTTICVGNEDDISFSDLEDEDDCTMPIKSTAVSKC